MRVCEPKKQGAHNRNFRISEHTVHARALGFGRFFCRFLKFFFLILYISYSAPRRDASQRQNAVPVNSHTRRSGNLQSGSFRFFRKAFHAVRQNKTTDCHLRSAVRKGIARKRTVFDKKGRGVRAICVFCV